MLKKIMGFFKPAPSKPDYTEIEFSKIDKYLNFVLREKMGENNRTIIDVVASVNILKSDLQHELHNLHRKHLMNPNIPQREIQIMEGNRDTYVKRIAHFAGTIDFPKGYLELYEYCILFSAQLDALGSELQRNVFILNHFFENEVKTINRLLSDIEKKVIDIRIFFEKNNIQIVRDIQELLKKRADNELKKADLKHHIADEQAPIDAYNEKIAKLQERITTITNGADYRTLQSFQEEKSRIEQEYQEIAKMLRADFSELDTALRKYYYRNPDKRLIKIYLDNPDEGLLQDASLEITSFLNELSELLKEGSIDLKDKKRERTLETLDKLSAAYLSNLRIQLHKLHHEKTAIQTKITHNSASLNLSEQQYWIKNTQDRIVGHEKEIVKFTAEIAKIDEKNKELLEQVRLDLEKIVGENILIVMDKSEQSTL